MLKFTEYLNENYIGGDIPNIESGLSYIRINQPQIDDIDAFKADLEDNGIPHYSCMKSTDSLIPTQADYNDDKVMGIISDINNQTKPIIVSNDDYILDGHHRWLGHDEVSGNVPSMVVAKPLDEIHDFLQGKPYVTHKGINETLEMSPVDDDYLEEALYEGKVVQLYKPIKEAKGKSSRFAVYTKDGDGVIARKKFMTIKPYKRKMDKVIQEMLAEGEYIDNIRRQLVDLLRLRLSIADISVDKFSDLLQSEIDKIMTLSPSEVIDMYDTEMVNNKIYDIKNVNESLIDIHREIALANSHENIIKAYQKHFRDSPNDRRLSLLVPKTSRAMFKELAGSGHDTDAYMAAKYADDHVRDLLKTHHNPAVRFEAARSYNNHPDLSKDSEAMVRYNVAKHAFDHKILKKLAGDSDIHVAQMALARSKQINNPKHVEVFTHHNAAHNQTDDTLQMSDLHPQFQSEVHDAIADTTPGWMSPLAHVIRKKLKGLE